MLVVIAQRYTGETENEQFEFTIDVLPCFNVLEDSVTTYEHEYLIGEPMLQLELVER